MITQVGMMRKLTGRMRNLFHAHGFKGEDQWGMDIESAAAEAVVAKYLNCYWSPGGVQATADVGESVQVRWSSREGARLILHEKDNDDQAFVLVTGALPRFELHGWVYGREAKAPGLWEDPGTGRPAFFVAQKYLKPMTELRLQIAEERLKAFHELP